jgi:hypothetical protein
MFDASQVDHIQAEMEKLRSMLITDRDAASSKLAELIGQATTLRDEARETAYAPAVDSMCELLLALQRSLDVQTAMNQSFSQFSESVREAA